MALLRHGGKQLSLFKEVISEIDQQTLDIDWFFTNGNHIAFVASGGGKLPHSVASLDKQLKALSDYFWTLTPNGEAIFDNSKNPVDADLTHWIGMAEIGLFAYDKTVMNSFSDLNYHLVAQPSIPLTISNLPLEVMEILNSVSIDFAMQEHLDIRLFDK